MQSRGYYLCRNWMGKHCDGVLSCIFSPSLCSVTLCLELEIGHSGSFYTMDIGKSYDLGLLLPWRAGCSTLISTPLCLAHLLTYVRVMALFTIAGGSVVSLLTV